MRVLNLYAGLGGNRKLWDNVEVTAVESNPETARIYADFFPSDAVVVGDAHEFLRSRFSEFDFIWSSPPCTTHSRARYGLGVLGHGRLGRNGYEPRYPNFRLYEEVVFLQYHFKGQWAVENVIGYYPPLVPPQRVSRHFFWSNFPIRPVSMTRLTNIRSMEINKRQKAVGFDLSRYSLSAMDKLKLLRNCVNPKLGKMVLDCARGKWNLPTDDL